VTTAARSAGSCATAAGSVASRSRAPRAERQRKLSTIWVAPRGARATASAPRCSNTCRGDWLDSGLDSVWVTAGESALAEVTGLVVSRGFNVVQRRAGTAYGPGRDESIFVWTPTATRCTTWRACAAVAAAPAGDAPGFRQPESPGKTDSVLHTVYLPLGDDPRLATIVRGSGIVGELQGDGSLLLDFEGNAYGASNLERFANRVLKAAARQAERYPTRARLLIEPEHVVAIGEFDAREQVVRLTGADSEARLAAWLDVPEVDPQRADRAPVSARIVAIDWSGRAKRAGEHIWSAEVVDGRLVEAVQRPRARRR